MSYRDAVTYLTYSGNCMRRTDKAALIRFENYARELWVPLSVLSQDTLDTLTVVIAEPQDISIADWWARREL